jgi:hypothetical protein
MGNSALVSDPAQWDSTVHPFHLRDPAKYQHHHKTLQIINTTTRHCKLSTPPQDTAKYQHHHKTLQNMRATSETLQCIKTMHGTLHSIPITWNADMGTHVKELAK